VFASYLTGQEPSGYVVEQYIQAHHCGVLGPGTTRFERVLVTVAGYHRLLTRMADAYARFFDPRSALRNKLVLLLALLETSAPSYRWVDDVPSGSRAGTLASVLGHGIIGTICLVLGLILFTPIRLLASTKKSSRT